MQISEVPHPVLLCTQWNTLQWIRRAIHITYHMYIFHFILFSQVLIDAIYAKSHNDNQPYKSVLNFCKDVNSVINIFAWLSCFLDLDWQKTSVLVRLSETVLLLRCFFWLLLSLPMCLFVELRAELLRVFLLKSFSILVSTTLRVSKIYFCVWTDWNLNIHYCIVQMIWSVIFIDIDR